MGLACLESGNKAPWLEVGSQRGILARARSWGTGLVSHGGVGFVAAQGEAF